MSPDSEVHARLPRVNRIFLLAVLILVAIPAWKLFATLPVQGVFINQVIPAEARAGDVVVLTGYALDAQHIEDVYLISEDEMLYKVEILGESGRDLRFRVPAKMPAGPARIAVKEPGKPGLFDQMIYLKVLEPVG